jgi:cation:H+ antiporter
MGAADRLVLAAVRISRALGVSAVLVGALIVGLGTSIPELLVSALAARTGELDVAMGNVVGSNVANVSLVLGAAALLGQVVTRTRALRREWLLMIVALAALAVVLEDGRVSRLEGVLLLVGLVVAIGLLLRWSSEPDARDAAVPVEDEDDGEVVVWIEAIIGVASLAVTVFAADLLLGGSLDLGERIGLAPAFLGLLLGVGTSLPELATTLAAVRRHQSDLIVGNILGSNLFNSLAVAGTAAVVGPGVLQDVSVSGLVAMVVAALIAATFSYTGERLVRAEGVVLVAVFFVFSMIIF